MLRRGSATDVGGQGVDVIVRTQPATIARRSLSWLVDALVLVVLLFPVFVVVGTVDQSQDPDEVTAGTLVALVALAVIPAVYFVVFEGRSGTTIGKRVAHLRVAATDGREQIGLWVAFRRHLGRCFSLLPIGIGYAWAATSAHRTWHDSITATVVVDRDQPVVVEDDHIPEPIHPPVPAPAPVPVAHAPIAPPSDDLQPPPDVATVDLFALSQRLRERHHFDEAATVLHAALHAGGDQGDGAGWDDVALLLIDAGWFAEALYFANRVLLDDPTHWRAEAIRALALAGQGGSSLDEALEVSSKAMIHSNRDALAVVAHAVALQRNGRQDEATEALDCIRDVAGTHERILQTRFLVARAQGDAAAAEHWAHELLTSAPFDAANHIRMAMARLEEPMFLAPLSRLQRWKAAPRILWRHAFRGHRVAERAAPLVAALRREPQHQYAWTQLLALETWADAKPSTVAGNAAAVLIPLLALTGFLLPISLAFTLPAVAVVGGAATVSYLRERREMGGEAIEWLRYVRGVAHAEETRGALASRWTGRRIAVRWPDPPAGTVFEAAAGCHCDELQMLWGQLAADYRQQHLATRALLLPGVVELACPSSLAAWVCFEDGAVRSGPGGAARLCRIAAPMAVV